MLRFGHPPLKVRLADQALLAALKLLRILLLPWPMPFRILFGGWAGRIAGRFSKRRRIALKNLKTAFGDSEDFDLRRLEKILDESYRDFGRSLAEFLMSDSIDAKYFSEHVRIENESAFQSLVSAGKGVVLLTAHFGNWEFLNLLAGVRGHPLAVLAKPQKLSASDEYLNRLRARRGARVVMRGMDVRALYRTLLSGGLIGVLADQDGGPGGIFAPLFGRASSYPRGLARFSAKTGAPALPVFTARESLDRHRIHIGTPIFPSAGETEAQFEERVVAEFSRQLEDMIRAYPSQWMWAHRRWKTSPNREILVLDDGRKGHTHQSQALAGVVARRMSGAASSKVVSIRTEAVRYRSKWTRTALTAYGILTRGQLWGGMSLLRWGLTDQSFSALARVPADTLISCGTSTEAANLILARECGARSCYIQKPQFGAGRFSVVLAPGHDRLQTARNTLKTRGALSFVNADGLKQLRERARAEAGIPARARAAAVLVGGPSKHVVWHPQAVERIFFALREFSREHKLYLLITTSRRTDPAVESAVERLFVGEPTCPVIVIPTRSNPSLAYEGILAAADLTLVTLDSVSMISEAVATEKPVGIIDPSDGSAKAPSGKLGRFLSHLEKEGAIERIGSGNIQAFLSKQPVNSAGSQEPHVLISAAELLAG